MQLLPEPELRELYMNDLAKGLSPVEIEHLKATDSSGPKSFFIDPQLAFDLVGYIRRQKPLTADLLREIAYRDKIVSAIIALRKSQITNFTRRYTQRKNESGWKVCLRDPERKPTPSDKKRIDEVAYFIEHMGYTDAKNSYGPERDRFTTFCEKIVEDSLILDAASFERCFDMMGNLAEIYVVDGGTIRIVHREVEGAVEAVRYAQEWKGQILAYFTADELAYCVRHPRSDMRAMGYGFSDVEKLVETITSHLFAEQWNQRFFDQGSIPQGILSITGNVSQETLESFKRNWLTQVSGVQNAWRVPVIGVPEGRGVQWVPFHAGQRDMEFHEWLRYLINVICSVFQCDPTEIGFESYRGGGGDQTVFEARGEYKITASQDKGLFPLMQWLAGVINEEIISYIYPDLEFRWVGLRDKSEREALEFQQMEINMGKKTVNEIRAEEDLPQIDADWANAPANPTLVQVFMAKYQADLQTQMMEQQQAAMGGMGGAPMDPAAMGAGAPPGMMPGMPPGAPPEGAMGQPGMPPEGAAEQGPPPASPEDAQAMIGGMNALADQAR